MKKRTYLLRTADGKSFLIPFILITSLFFLWGTAHSILDVLNKHFQDVLGISKSTSGLVQFSVYGAYFVMAIPAGLFMKKYGYRKGIILGLLLFATGAYLFIPVGIIQEFWAVLVALFILASGLACLETAANPYSTVLGPKESAASRINLSQSFNGMGWIVGPLLGGMLIFGNKSIDGNNFSSVVLPYTIIGTVVLLIAIFFFFIKLPEIEPETEVQVQQNKSFTEVVKKSLWKYPHFYLAVLAQFFYVAAQTGVNSFFINYVVENMPQFNELKASQILAFGGMGAFFIGRLSGSYIMKIFNPERLLLLYAIANTLLMALTVVGMGMASIVALFMSYFFMSIMFPTIFALGIRNLGPLTQKASSFIVMSIVGGAFCPMLMGRLADLWNMNIGFIIPMICFALVAVYALNYKKLIKLT